MSKATITSKGQITIPAAVRSDLNIGPGDRVEFVKNSQGTYEMITAALDISELRGMVKTDRTVSVEEMGSAIKKRAGR